MKKLLRNLNVAARETLLNWCGSAMNFASERICGPAHEDSLRYAFGCWIDRTANRVFTWAYDGSDSEERGALDAGIPAKYMSERQRAIALAAFVNPVAHCNQCCWCGFVDQAVNYTCPSCSSESIYWDERERAYVPYRDYRALALVPVCRPEIGGSS